MRNADSLREEFGCVEGLRASVAIEEGPVDKAVLDVATRERADLIVTGIALSGPLAQVLVGSSVTALVRKSSIPLLVVKKKVLDTDGRVIVASDLSDSSKPALAVGLRWFPLRRLELFYGFEPPYRNFAADREVFDRNFETSALVQCRDFLAETVGEHAATKFEVVARQGDPVVGLQALTNNAGTDLVIAGTHGKTGLLHALVGSVASRILEAVPCDVLVVPGERQ
jgi:nucleotide-binding universal stress UspA family protein